MADLEDQRVCVKFCLKLAKTFIETFQMLEQAYGEGCLSQCCPTSLYIGAHLTDGCGGARAGWRLQ
jgi:hypothetical protein